MGEILTCVGIPAAESAAIAANRRSGRGARAVPAFWASDSLQTGRERLAAMDRERGEATAREAACARLVGELGVGDAGAHQAARGLRLASAELPVQAATAADDGGTEPPEPTPPPGRPSLKRVK